MLREKPAHFTLPFLRRERDQVSQPPSIPLGYCFVLRHLWPHLLLVLLVARAQRIVVAAWRLEGPLAVLRGCVRGLQICARCRNGPSLSDELMWLSPIDDETGSRR